MSKIRIATAAVTAAVAAGLLIAAPASASTTQTSGPFSVHVVGSGLHIDYIWFSESLHSGESFHGVFWVEIDSPNGEHQLYYLQSHHYDFRNTHGIQDPTVYTYSTGRYYVSKSFPNHSLGFGGEYRDSYSNQHGIRFTVHT